MDAVFNICYQELAVKYPQLGEFIDNGRFFYSYKGQCLLTSVLLREYFNIHIHILEGHLIPAIPSRVLYLKIVKRILEESHCLRSSVRGLDIGTGPYAIYALLGHRGYQWDMTGIDIDPMSVLNAGRTILDNGLSIIVKEGDGIVGEGYDFMVCNPPFYSSKEEMDEKSKQKQTLNRESVVAKDTELVCEGGEAGFVRRLVDQSKGNQCVWFSSLLGIKSSVVELISYLQQVHCVNFHVQEYHLGSTKRWVLFWSHQYYRPQILNSSWSNVKATVFENKFDLAKVRSVISSMPVEIEENGSELQITVPGIVWSRQYRRSPSRLIKSKHIFIVSPTQIHFLYGQYFKTFQSFYNYLKQHLI
jgi:23S rRNA A1618 N6-methylase RlmF